MQGEAGRELHRPSHLHSQALLSGEVNGLCAHSLPSRETRQIGSEIRVVFTASPLCPHRRFPEVIHLAVLPSIGKLRRPDELIKSSYRIAIWHTDRATGKRDCTRRPSLAAKNTQMQRKLEIEAEKARSDPRGTAAQYSISAV
jgi:hypothetical protein